MPDIAVHASFGGEVRRALPAPVSSRLQENVYTLGLFGPDLWFMHRPWQRRSGRGRRMHTTRTGNFLMALARRAAVSPQQDALFSYLAGFLCHYALDSTAHPYIIDITARVHHFPRSHMSLEHALDLCQLERDGFLGEAHPVTDHYFPVPVFPPALAPDLNAVFEEVYGWKQAFPALCRSARLYRKSYRLMENPRGLAARLARRTGHDLLRSLAYSESQFRNMDPENLEHRPWQHSHDASQNRGESFPELRQEAARMAVELITAVRGFLDGTVTEAALTEKIGSRSYLSGLPVDDARNHLVSSLRPPKKDA